MAAYIDLKPGTQIFVAVPGRAGDPYHAMIRAISRTGMTLTGAQRDNEFLEVEVGEAVELFVRYGGRNYRMGARVSSLQVTPSLGFSVSDVSEAEQSERRAFFRLETRIQPSYAARLDEDEGAVRLSEVTILDLSGGGVRLRTVDPVPAGARLQLVFALDDDPLEVDVEVEALSVVPPEPARRYFHVHCTFVDTPRQVTERVVRFVFRQQAAENQRRAS